MTHTPNPDWDTLRQAYEVGCSLDQLAAMPAADGVHRSVIHGHARENDWKQDRAPDNVEIEPSHKRAVNAYKHNLTFYDLVAHHDLGGMRVRDFVGIAMKSLTSDALVGDEVPVAVTSRSVFIANSLRKARTKVENVIGYMNRDVKYVADHPNVSCDRTFMQSERFLVGDLTDVLHSINGAIYLANQDCADLGFDDDFFRNVAKQEG